MPIRAQRWACLFSCFLFVAACGDDDDVPLDATGDVAGDATVDAGDSDPVDGGTDATTDPLVDAGGDTAVDAGPPAECVPGDGPPAEAAPSCTQGVSSDLAGLSPTATVSYLRSKPSTCLYFLWTLDGNVASSLSNDANIRAVSDALVAGAGSYAGNNANAENSLLFYLRLRWYHDFYGGDRFAGSDRPQMLIATESALSAMAGAVDPSRAGDGEHQVIETLAQAADGASLLHTQVPLWTSVLNAGADAVVDGSITYYRGNALFGLMAGMARAVSNGDEAFIASVDDGLFNALARLATDGCAPEFIINNAIYTLGFFSSIDRFRERGQRLLTDLLERFPRVSQPFLWIVGALDDHHGCMTADGDVLCRDTIVPEIEDTVFPNTWVMGNITFRTPLSFEETLRLHYALTQVRHRFERIMESAPPISGDMNEMATFKIYGTRDAYETYNGWLYGLSTSNGGIYIEQDGTLYTYERTPEESVFTLEELVRHEYVHYLLGRYAAAGLWGDHPIYDSNRMVFYDEGIAEFLAWGTSRRGIRTRAQLVDNIRSDSAYMTVNEITRASYASGFRFYNYAGLFFDYLYRNRLSTMRNLMFAARDGSTSGMDGTIASLRSDSGLNAAYHAYLTDLLADGSLDDIETTIPSAPLSGSLSEIQSAINATRLGAAATCEETTAGARFRGFRCTGTITGSVRPSYSEDEAWRTIDASLDELLEDAADSGIPNFELMNCSFSEITLGMSGGEYPIAEYACEGPFMM